MVREEIRKLVEKAILELQKEKVFPVFKIPEIKIEHPEVISYGDYSTNIALNLARQVKKSPMEISESLKSQILELKSKIFEKVEAVKPGFINFFLSPEYLQEKVGHILKEGDKFGSLNIGKNRKVNVEFISANPTGPLHIGHGRGAFFGDCLANILSMAGYGITREYFINDGRFSHQIIGITSTASTIGGKSPEELEGLRPGDLPYYGEYLRETLKIMKPGDEIVFVFQEKNKKFITDKLKIKFDKWISEEKDLIGKGKVEEILSFLEREKLVYEKDGAKWLQTSKYGEQLDWVIKRKDGTPTYFLTDIAYHKDKFYRGFSKIINIWGADHHGYVGRIKAAAKILNYKGNLDILISQIVRLKSGKISKRKGEITTLEWLVNQVGLDVTRFFYLTKSLNAQMEFDLDLGKEQSEKNPVFYVQYAHARICSILRKFGKSQISGHKPHTNSKFKLLNHPSELNLIKQLLRLPEIVEDTARDYQVQRLPQYTLDLATAFHQFYRDCKVISEDKDLTKARLTLILATKTVLKNTLDLMGISAPEKM